MYGVKWNGIVDKLHSIYIFEFLHSNITDFWNDNLEFYNLGSSNKDSKKGLTWINKCHVCYNFNNV